MRRERRVRSLLSRLVLISTLLVAAVGLFATGAVAFIYREVVEYRSQVVPAAEAAEVVQDLLTDAHTDMEAYLKDRAATSRDQYRQHQRRFWDELAGVRNRARTDRQRELTDAVARSAGVWFDRANADIATIERGEAAPTDTHQYFIAARRDATALRDEMQSFRVRERSRYEGLIGWGLVVSAVVTVAGVGLMLMQSHHVTRRIIGSLDDLRRIVVARRKGRTDVMADEHTGVTEVSQIGTAFNELLTKEREFQRGQRLELRRQELATDVITALRRGVREPDAFHRMCLILGLRLSAVQVVVYQMNDRGRLAPNDWWARDGAMVPVFHQALADMPERQLKARLESSVAITDVSGEERLFSERGRHLLEKAGIRSLLVSPVLIGEQLGGVVTVADPNPREWKDAEIRTVTQCASFAGQTALERDHIRSLEDLDRQKSEFLATTSHELRTPLTSIAGYLEMLEDGDMGDLEPEQAATVRVIGRNVVRLRSMIEDLLMLNHLDSGTPFTSVQKVDVTALAARVAESLHPQATGGQVDMQVTGSLSDDRVLGDSARLERALTNLVANAIKFTPPGGKVGIHTYRDGGDAVVEVSDSGIGIPEADMTRLFSRFFRASNATSREIPGTGLGLAIVKAIVDAHQGTIGVMTAEGEGSRFTVRLPLALEDDSTEPSTDSQTGSQTEAERTPA